MTIADLRAGLDIFEKHVGPEIDIATEHDEIYGPPNSDLKDKLSAEDKRVLKKAGWFLSKDHGCWMHFT